MDFNTLFYYKIAIKSSILDLNKLRKQYNASVEVVKALSKITGANFNIVSAQADSLGRYVSPNGIYDPNTNTFTLDILSGMNNIHEVTYSAMVNTAGHELTHYIQNWNAEAYSVLKKLTLDFLESERGSGWIDTQLERIKESNSHLNKNLTDEQARDELVADAFGDVLSKVDFAETIHKADKRLFDKIAEWLDKLLERFKKALRTATEGVTARSGAAATLREAGDRAMHLFNSWSDAFASALENSTARAETQAVDGDVQYEARTVNGKKVAWIEDNILLQKDGRPEHQVIHDYISQHIGEYYTIFESGQKVYIGEDLPNEYTQSEYTKDLKNTPSKLKAKKRAAIGLGSMIEIATNRKWQSVKNPETKDAKYGFYKYDTCFAFPVYVGDRFIGVKAYRANLLIRNASDGKKYLYDVINIKKDDAMAGELNKRESRQHISEARLTSSNTKITQTDPNVNTQSSKKQFSARDYTYESLIKKPDMKVTTVSSVVPDTRADVIAEAKKNAAAIGKTNKDGSVSVYVKDVETDVILSRNGLEHGLDRRFKEIAPVTIRAGEIIQNSIRINELIPSKEEADASYVLIGAAQNSNGDMYIIRSVVNKFSNELDTMDVLYAINAKKESTAVLNAPLVSTPDYRTAISISQLLDFVNDNFPDILPESVLKHYGHKSRPEGKLGESALFSARDVYDVLDIEARKKQNEDIFGIDSYTEAQYHKRGWAFVNGILHGRMGQDVFSKIASIRHGNHFEKMPDGTYVIPTGAEESVNNTLVFTDGKHNNPTITQIITIALTEETELAPYRNFFIELLQENSDYDIACSVIETYVGKEVFSKYTVRDFESYRQLKEHRHNRTKGNGDSQHSNSRTDGASENTSDGSGELTEPQFSARDVYDVLDIETRADLAEHILTYIEDEGGYRAQLKRSIEKGELNKIKLTAQAYKEAVKVYQDAYRDLHDAIGTGDEDAINLAYSTLAVKKENRF